MSGPDAPREVVDLGLQSERTYLAWTRTGLSFAGVGALIVHGGVEGRTWLTAFGIFGLLVGAVILARSQWRYRATVAAVRANRTPAQAWLVAALAIANGILCVGGLALVISAAT